MNYREQCDDKGRCLHGCKVGEVCFHVRSKRASKPIGEGELRSWVRSVMCQGADIRVDYDMGNHKSYEAYSARLDVAAAERAEELMARLKTPNVEVSR